MVFFDKNNFLSPFNEFIKGGDTDSFLGKTQLESIYNLLDHNEAKTIIIEEEYLENSIYFHDYNEYYTFSFTPPPRLGKRVLFFSIDPEKMASFLRNADRIKDTTFIRGFLGFIFVRPLPECPIGLTLLKPFLKPNAELKATTSFGTYFLGCFFEVPFSLPYQEQDHNITACASIALWSALYIMHRKFFIRLPTPLEITRSAGMNYSGNNSSYGNSSKVFPNTGLKAEQVGLVITQMGLEYDKYEFDSKTSLSRSIIYAYLAAGLPVLADITRNQAHHLICLIGSIIKADGKKISDDSDICLHSDKVTHFIGHDDQSGPYQEFLYENNNIIIYGESKFEIVNIWIPSKYLRSNFVNIYSIVIIFDMYIKYTNNENTNFDYCWNIYLNSSNQYKNDVRRRKNQFGRFISILEENLPNYVWVAELKIKKSIQIDFIFDTTGNVMDSNLIKVLPYNKQSLKKINELYNNVYKNHENDIQKESSEFRRFFQELAGQIK